jgi:hypothetical protein
MLPFLDDEYPLCERIIGDIASGPVWVQEATSFDHVVRDER